MQRGIVTLPRSLMREVEFTWDIEWRGSPPADRVNGMTTTVMNQMPRWVGAPTMVLRMGQIAQWRAIRSAAQGRRNVYRVEMTDPVGFRVAEYPGYVAQGVPFDDGGLFDGGVGFRFAPFVTADSDFPAGSTTIRVDAGPVGIAPVVGQIMSHHYWPFVVTSVVHVSGDIHEITVQMPIRAAMSSGDAILMRGEGLFEADEGSGFAGYGAARISRPTLRFREWLTRP